MKNALGIWKLDVGVSLMKLSVVFRPTYLGRQGIRRIIMVAIGGRPFHVALVPPAA